MNIRIVKDRTLRVLVIVFAVAASLAAIVIPVEVAWRGWECLNLGFFMKPNPSTFEAMAAVNNGEPIPGGIANGIIGTFIIVALASVISIPIGLFTGIYLAEHRKGKFAAAVRFLSELLQGTPSIILGILAYLWVVVTMRNYSALAGSVALAIMMLPLIVRSTEETLCLLPPTLKESALALGASSWTTMFRVMLPSAMGGISTGILLAVSRVIGETAPLMLTALGANAIRWDPMRPMSSVSLLIWQFYNDPNLSSLIWSASLFLLIIVLTANLTAKQISKKWKIQS